MKRTIVHTFSFLELETPRWGRTIESDNLENAWDQLVSDISKERDQPKYETHENLMASLDILIVAFTDSDFQEIYSSEDSRDEDHPFEVISTFDYREPKEAEKNLGILSSRLRDLDELAEADELNGVEYVEWDILEALHNSEGGLMYDEEPELLLLSQALGKIQYLVLQEMRAISKGD